MKDPLNRWLALTDRPKKPRSAKAGPLSVTELVGTLASVQIEPPKEFAKRSGGKTGL